MNVWQKTLFTYVSIYVMALPLHAPEKAVIKLAIIISLAIFYLEGGFSEIGLFFKKRFRLASK